MSKRPAEEVFTTGKRHKDEHVQINVDLVDEQLGRLGQKLLTDDEIEAHIGELSEKVFEDQDIKKFLYGQNVGGFRLPGILVTRANKNLEQLGIPKDLLTPTLLTYLVSPFSPIKHSLFSSQATNTPSEEVMGEIQTSNDLFTTNTGTINTELTKMRLSELTSEEIAFFKNQLHSGFSSAMYSMDLSKNPVMFQRIINFIERSRAAKKGSITRKNLQLINSRLLEREQPEMNSFERNLLLGNEIGIFVKPFTEGTLPEKSLQAIVNYIIKSRLALAPSMLLKQTATKITKKMEQAKVNITNATSQAQRLERDQSPAHSLPEYEDSEASSAATLVPSVDSAMSTISVSYDPSTNSFQIKNLPDLAEEEEDMSPASQTSMVTEASIDITKGTIDTIDAITAQLVLMNLGLEQPPSREEPDDMSVAASSAARSILSQILPQMVHAFPDTLLTLVEVNKRVSVMVEQLSKRESVIPVGIPELSPKEPPLESINEELEGKYETKTIPAHSLLCVGLYEATTGEPIGPESAQTLATISAVPLLRDVNPDLYSKMTTEQQTEADMHCGARAAAACSALDLAELQTGAGLYAYQIIDSLSRAVTEDGSPLGTPCPLQFLTGDPEGFTNDLIGGENNIRALLINELKHVADSVREQQITCYIPILYTRVVNPGHFVRLVLTPDVPDPKYFVADPLNYGVFVVDPANRGIIQSLNEFLNSPMGEAKETIDSIALPTIFKSESVDPNCDLVIRAFSRVPAQIGIRLEPTIKLDTGGGAIATKKRTMKKHKKPKGSGNRSKNKRNKSARHMKKRVKHLLKAAKKRGQSGKHSKSSKNAKRKSRTKKDNTIKRLKIKGLGRTRKLNKHGRK